MSGIRPGHLRKVSDLLGNCLGKSWKFPEMLREFVQDISGHFRESYRKVAGYFPGSEDSTEKAKKEHKKHKKHEAAQHTMLLTLKTYSKNYTPTKIETVL